jgi:ferredoxin
MRTDLFFFSGTGNTSLAARAVAEALRKAGHTVRPVAVESADPEGYEPGDLLGIAFPAAAGATYPFVLDFIGRLPSAEGTGAFLVVTMAASAGGVSPRVREALAAKGYSPVGLLEVVMPTNFRRERDPGGEDDAVLARGMEESRGFAERLGEDAAEWPEGPGGFTRMVEEAQSLWRELRSRYRLSVAEDRCTGCGECADVCPVDNIVMEDGIPVFGDVCQVCMRCFSGCPEHAILVGGERYAQWRSARRPWEVD